VSIRDAPVHGDNPTAASKVGMQDHKELRAAAFERTRMPIVLADARQPDCPIVLANRAFLGLTGYSADEVLGRSCRFLQGNATSPAAIAELRFAVAEGRSTSVEILNYRKDGTQFWNQLHLSPIQDDDGKLAYYFASQIDVTEFRKVQSLEASEHRLLMEVDHRAKNVLAVVDSIVRLSKADEPAMYAASVQRRVQSLSQAHAILSSTRWTGVDFRRIIEAQIARFQHERIALIGPPVAVSPEIVQPLSLILHELIDNAVTQAPCPVRR
jgi:PAS domain S-box-containing protein